MPPKLVGVLQVQTIGNGGPAATSKIISTRSTCAQTQQKRQGTHLVVLGYLPNEPLKWQLANQKFR